MTLVWAFFATFTNYIAGMILAVVINRKETRAKGFWRFCFVLPCAVPMFVSLLIMRTMLQPDGAVNVAAAGAGVIAEGASLPFFTDPTWARVTVIVINIWVGVPTPCCSSPACCRTFPPSCMRAAKVDGANSVQTFFRITLPYMLYVTTPLPDRHLHRQREQLQCHLSAFRRRPGHRPCLTAGSTDLLVTWLYKLTIDKQYYNVGAVGGHSHLHHSGHRLAAHLPQQQSLP